jgi:hypothetical protein
MLLLDSKVDVLVIGGGTAGTIAALQAARLGARTLLLEMGGQLGGTMTTGGVAFPGLFDAWGKQVIAGIGWELVKATVELDGGELPDFSRVPEHHYGNQVRINPGLYAALAEQACLAAEVELCYYEMPLEVERTDGGWRVQTVGKAMRRDIECRQLIDCTGGADVVGMLGLPRQREDTIQPGTFGFSLVGINLSAADPQLTAHRYQDAVTKGTLWAEDYYHDFGRFAALLHGAFGLCHVMDADDSTSPAATASNIAGRESMLRTLRFARTLPGCENARVQRVMGGTSVRETYRIVGETQVTVEDYRAGRRYPDAICYAFYPLDLHDEQGVSPEPLRPGVVPTIPFGALVPKGTENLLVAGRCVASDRLANSALRVQAPCMAMGQAAGAAAALAAGTGTAPTALALENIKAALEDHGAIVP